MAARPHPPSDTRGQPPGFAPSAGQLSSCARNAGVSRQGRAGAGVPVRPPGQGRWHGHRSGQAVAALSPRGGGRGGTVSAPSCLLLCAEPTRWSPREAAGHLPPRHGRPRTLAVRGLARRSSDLPAQPAAVSALSTHPTTGSASQAPSKAGASRLHRFSRRGGGLHGLSLATLYCFP